VLGLDIDDNVWMATAPGELFEPGERWKLVSIGGPGFIEAHLYIVNRDAAKNGLPALVCEAIGERFLTNAGIAGDAVPALPAFVPEGAEVEAPGYPIIRVPAHLWPGCWANPNRTGDREEEFGQWVWKQPHACAEVEPEPEPGDRPASSAVGELFRALHRISQLADKYESQFGLDREAFDRGEDEAEKVLQYFAAEAMRRG
jgi:hypothetical protein